MCSGREWLHEAVLRRLHITQARSLAIAPVPAPIKVGRDARHTVSSVPFSFQLPPASWPAC